MSTGPKTTRPKPDSAIERLGVAADRAVALADQAKKRVRAAKVDLKKARKTFKTAKKAAKLARKIWQKAKVAPAADAADVSPPSATVPAKHPRPRRSAGRSRATAAQVARRVIGRLERAETAQGLPAPAPSSENEPGDGNNGGPPTAAE